MSVEFDGPKPPKNEDKKSAAIGGPTIEMEIVSLHALYEKSPHPIRRIIQDKLAIAAAIRKYRGKFSKEKEEKTD